MGLNHFGSPGSPHVVLGVENLDNSDEDKDVSKR